MTNVLELHLADSLKSKDGANTTAFKYFCKVQYIRKTSVQFKPLQTKADFRQCIGIKNTQIILGKTCPCHCSTEIKEQNSEDERIYGHRVLAGWIQVVGLAFWWPCYYGLRCKVANLER